MRAILSILIILTSFVLSSDYGEVYNKILEKFSRTFGLSKGDIELQIYNFDNKNILLSDKGYEVQLNDRRHRLGLTTIWIVKKDHKGVVIEKFPITVKVSASFDALVAKEDISPGEVINSKNIEIRKIKVERGNLDFFRAKDLPEIGNVVAKRFIRKGEILREHMVKQKPDVTRGTKVKVKLRSKNFDVITDGILKEDGYLNEKVRVTCEPAGKVLTGILKDPELVVVELR